MGLRVLTGASDILDLAVKHADRALFQAKPAGRNRVVVYPADADTHSRGRAGHNS